MVRIDEITTRVMCMCWPSQTTDESDEKEGAIFFSHGLRRFVANTAPKELVVHPTRLPPRFAGTDLDQIIYCPPLTVSVEPVMNPDSSATRKTTQRATSSGSPSRRTGIWGRIDFSNTSFGTAFTISVAM